MKLLKFQQYITEAIESSDLEELARLKKLGIISPQEYYVQGRGARRDAVIKSDSPEHAIPEVREALESEAAKKLMALGLHLVSSKTQLINGNLIFSLDPNYKPHDGWGIGFFIGPKKIRRMTPKGINVGVWRRDAGSMDIGIKYFHGASDEDFYQIAMEWAAENIDFDHAKANTAINAWKYYTKKHLAKDK